MTMRDASKFQKYIRNHKIVWKYEKSLPIYKMFVNLIFFADSKNIECKKKNHEFKKLSLIFKNVHTFTKILDKLFAIINSS